MGLLEFPTKEEDVRVLLQNVKTKIGQFQVTLGLTQAEVDAVTEDCDNYEYLVDFAFQVRKDFESFFEFKKQMFLGTQGPMPEAPSFTSVSMPGPGGSGIVARQKAFKARVMLSPGYNQQIGEVLGYVPPVPVPPDPSEMVPAISIAADPDGKVSLNCSRKTADSVRWEYLIPNSTGWSHLADTTRAKNTIQLPATLLAQPQKLVVRARYIKNNQPIGDYSATKTVVTNP